MPYSDPILPPDGFEGIITEESTSKKPKGAIGFEGFAFTSGATGYRRPPIAFEGFIIEWPTATRFIKVTDFRGNPILNCFVTVENTGGDYTAKTDLSGVAPVEIDISGTKTIRLIQNKTRKSFTYTYSSEALTKTVILQPPLL